MLTRPDGRPLLAIEKGPVVKLGALVHVIAGPEDDCLAGWIGHVDPAGAVQALVVSPDGPVVTVPIARYATPQIEKPGPRVLSWHTPSECPWGK